MAGKQTDQTSCAGDKAGDRYAYTALPQGKWTRLVQLLPGAFDDPIEVDLITVELDDDMPSYEAVSYAWGDPNDTRSITCGGKILQPTKNLFAGL